MDLCEEAIALFCRDQGVVLAPDAGPLVRLALRDIGTVQFERHAGQLTFWLAFAVVESQRDRAMLGTLTRVYSARAPLQPLRCGMLANGDLVLMVSLDEDRVSAQQLHETYRLLNAVRAEVLDA
ncbi:hypothetical protein [Pseudomonas sp. MWU13-3659]|uniref:hypothetical protein n=1 Tax=Pseudomonas sp. MWU13-3659 TaxID=2986964 RepID=UPI002075131C|nr:hypothetical protein [Pseudomonas sp. MWU13-3659]